MSHHGGSRISVMFDAKGPYGKVWQTSQLYQSFVHFEVQFHITLVRVKKKHAMVQILYVEGAGEEGKPQGWTGESPKL